MKTFNVLTQQLQHWGRELPLGRRCQLPASDSSIAAAPAGQHRSRKSPPPVMWVLAAVSLTTVAGHRFYNQPKLNIGTKATETIRAPFSASIEDSKSTEEKRKLALSGFVPVLMFDEAATQLIYQELQKALSQGDSLRSQAGAFPFVKTSTLSNSTQLYLRQAEEWEWRIVLTAVESASELAVPGFSPSDISSNPVNPSFAPAVSELQFYRRLTSPQAFDTLIKTISLSRQRYSKALAKISLQADDNGSHYDAKLLDLSNENWKKTQAGIRQAAECILTQGIPPGLPPSILQKAARMQVTGLVPTEAQPLATKLLLGVLRTNLTKDQHRTQEQAELAALAVEPSTLAVERGEAIVYAGEEITQGDFLLLDYFGLSKRGINWLGLLGFGGIVTGAVGIYWLVEKRVYQLRAGDTPPLRRRDHFLVLLLGLSTPLLGTFGATYTNLPAIGLLVGGFYGPAMGVTVVGLLTGLVTGGVQLGWDYLLASTAGGLLGAMLAGRMRSREELALLGGGVALTQGAVYLLVNVIFSAAAGSIWYIILQDAAIYAFYGLAWSIVALGISPYLEHLFDLVTPIRLAELSNPNRPLLKRLAAETPGTFQHTLFVANFAEAAARELGCNVELVRAGTLYHDIGKMHDPLGFIENQMGGANKHDEINNPWESAEIIKKHVTLGLVMANKHRLPKAIKAFIPEHQGTISIAYFYHQAKQMADRDPNIIVREEDFRYDGPIPQSRETGIVMLADACEAALRSLKDATPETALSTINKIFRARWQDNQLRDSGLTREDLSRIAEIFVQVWQQSNHQRIAYPKAALCPK